MRKQHLPRVERKQLQGEKHEGVSKAEEKQKDLPLIGRLKKETLCVCGGGGSLGLFVIQQGTESQNHLEQYPCARSTYINWKDRFILAPS